VIVEFPAKQWIWHMLCDLLRIIESIGFAKRLSGSNRRCSECRSELIQISSRLVIQGGQPGHSFS